MLACLRRILPLLALVGALPCAACDDISYPPESLVTRIRVLSVRAEPPFLGPAGPSTLAPLVAGTDAELCHAWAFCPFALSQDGNFRCFDELLQVDLGTGATATVGMPEILASVAKVPEVFAKHGLAEPDTGRDPGRREPGQPADPDPPEFYVLFQVSERAMWGGTCPTDTAQVLRDPCPDRSRCIAGFKPMAFATEPSQQHANPVLTGLQLDGVDWPDDVTPVLGPPAPVTPTEVPEFGDLGPGYALVPLFTPESVELVAASAEPGLPDRKETLIFAWYTTAGDFAVDRTDHVFADTRFRAPKGTQGEKLARLWVVVRDGRGGTDWLTRQVRLVAKAPEGVHPLCAEAPALKGCPQP